MLRYLNLFLVLAWPLAHTAQETQQPPNIIIIFADDLGYGDLACYGHPTVRTPYLDNMAHEGMRFTQFYAAASVCTPSRAALLTGRYPIRTGLVRGLIPGRVLFPNDTGGLLQEEVTIAEMLKEQGYATACIGKWHLGHLPEFLPTEHGFDSYFGIPYSNDMDHVGPKGGKPAFWNVPLMRDKEITERPAVQTTLTKRYTAEAVDFIDKNAGSPFFLYLAHTMPHIPLFTSPDFQDTSLRGLYGDVVEEIDWSVGEILRVLEENGLEENTLVIFTSDNGPWLVQRQNGGSAGLLHDGKGTTWEGGMRVPMIARWPGTIPANETAFSMASTMDLLPTIADIVHAGPPDRHLDGESIASVLKGEGSAPGPDRFFAYFRDDRLYAARLGAWKAHFYTQTGYPAGPLNKHDPPLLYHLEVDPSERYDVAGDHPDVVAAIRTQADALIKGITTIRIPNIEAEALIDDVEVTGGRLRIQEMGGFDSGWSNDAHLWWVEASPGDQLHFPISVEEAGDYELFGFFTRAGDYGIISVSVRGEQLGDLMDGYNDRVEWSGPVSFGKVYLNKGENILTIKLIGKDVRSAGYSDGYLVGIDGFLLRRLNAK